METILLFNN